MYDTVTVRIDGRRFDIFKKVKNSSIIYLSHAEWLQIIIWSIIGIDGFKKWLVFYFKDITDID